MITESASIALLIDHMGLGGSQTIVRMLFDDLRRHGIAVEIVTNDRRDESRHCSEWTASELRLVRVIQSIIQSLKFAWRPKYQIVHLHSPCVTMVLAAIVMKLRGRKLLYTVHANRTHVSAWAWNLEILLFRLSDVVILELKASITDLQKGKARPKRMHWIPFGVSENCIQARWAHHPEKKRFKFIVVSRLDADRRVHTILDAYLKAVPEPTQSMDLVIVGDGSDLEWLKKKANERNRDDITFSPPVREEEIQDVLKECDCMVTMSAAGEVGMAGKIAAGIGMPIIAIEMEDEKRPWTARNCDELSELMLHVYSLPISDIANWRDSFTNPLRSTATKMLDAYRMLYINCLRGATDAMMDISWPTEANEGDKVSSAR